MNLRDKMLQLEQRMNAQVLGQENVVRMLIIALLCDGHILLEGLPGLAKTRAVRELARHILGEFRRIQFTPDLLPSDITGSEIYQQNASRERGAVSFSPGTGFRQRDSGGRNQPRLGPRGVGAAGGDAPSSATSPWRAKKLAAAGRVYGAGDAEPRRPGRHLAATGSPARPLSDESTGRLSIKRA